MTGLSSSQYEPYFMYWSPYFWHVETNALHVWDGKCSISWGTLYMNDGTCLKIDDKRNICWAMFPKECDLNTDRGMKCFVCNWRLGWFFQKMMHWSHHCLAKPAKLKWNRRHISFKVMSWCSKFEYQFIDKIVQIQLFWVCLFLLK